LADACHICDKTLATAIVLRAGVSEVLCGTVSFMKVGTSNVSCFFMLHVVPGRVSYITHQIVTLSSSFRAIGAPGSRIQHSSSAKRHVDIHTSWRAVIEFTLLQNASVR